MATLTGPNRMQHNLEVYLGIDQQRDYEEVHARHLTKTQIKRRYTKGYVQRLIFDAQDNANRMKYMNRPITAPQVDIFS